MGNYVNYSVSGPLLRSLERRAEAVSTAGFVSHHLYAKYLTLWALEQITPEDLWEFKKQYDRRASSEKQVSSFKEKLANAKPYGWNSV